MPDLSDILAVAIPLGIMGCGYYAARAFLSDNPKTAAQMRLFFGSHPLTNFLKALITMPANPNMTSNPITVADYRAQANLQRRIAADYLHGKNRNMNLHRDALDRARTYDLIADRKAAAN